ncbi:MAG: hypothetical protein AAF320_02865 [Myxococcota bacterium]
MLYRTCFKQLLAQFVLFTHIMGCGSASQEQSSVDLGELLLTQQHMQHSEQLVQSFSPEQTAGNIQHLKQELASNTSKLQATQQTIVQTQEHCMRCFLDLMKKEIAVGGGRVDDSNVESALETRRNQLQEEINLCSKLEQAFFFHISKLLISFYCSLTSPFDMGRWLFISTDITTKILQTLQELRLEQTTLCPPLKEILVQMSYFSIKSMLERGESFQKKQDTQVSVSQQENETEFSVIVNKLKQARRQLFSMIKP